MPFTVVFLHAHPDDEALLTGGTIARLSSEGHRVVLVTATDGAAGLTSSSTIHAGSLASVRRRELLKSAEILGVSRTVQLGYGDSGLDGSGAPSTLGGDPSMQPPFAGVDLDTAAAPVAEVVAQERAAVLVGYDAAGGYGHPDHVQVHRVARRVSDLSPGVTLLEATLPREPLAWSVGTAYRLRHVVPALRGLDPNAWSVANSPRAEITHRVDVRGFTDAKRAALAAHVSQSRSDADVRTLHVLSALPRPVFRLLMGWEWFVGPRSAYQRYSRHPLAGIRKS